MRLTSDAVLEADQGLNCIGDRELVLRNKAIPEIENLAVARDGFDTIDLSANMISVLGDGFPLFSRLQKLYLGANRITRILSGIADSLPNLRVLVLTSNRLKTIEDLNLPELSRFAHLELLSIIDNPISDKPGIRQTIIDKLPSLKILNFRKVSLEERKAVPQNQKKLLGKRKSTALSKDRKHQRTDVENKKANHHTVVGTEEDLQARKRTKRKREVLSKQQSEALRLYVEQAQTVEEVMKMQEAVKSGTVAEFLRTVEANGKGRAVEGS